MREKMIRSKLRYMFAVIIMFFTLLFVTSASDVNAAGLNVTSHTKAEIAQYIDESGISIEDPVSFATVPDKNGVVGELSDDSKNSALKMLNVVRYVAGLDPVSLNAEQGRKAQATAYVDWFIGMLTHFPNHVDGDPNKAEIDKPAGISDTVWADGVEGAGSSNIAYGRDTITDTIVNGWMGDKSSASNVKSVGHRRWCLNPKMGTTGFGATTGSSYLDKYYAMWSFDSTASGTQNNVAWPAQKMPIEFFDNNMCWHLSTGNTSINNQSQLSNVSVTLTRKNGSPSGTGEWNFSTNESYTPQKGTSKYFGVELNSMMHGYSGQPGPFVVFRPDNIDYEIGDKFDVEITGVGDTINYEVEFISGYPIKEISFEDSEYTLSGSSVSIKPVISPSDAKGYEVQYSSSNENVATVNSNGTVTKVGVGTTTITAEIDGKYTNTGQPVTASYTLKVPKRITDEDVLITYDDYVDYSAKKADLNVVIQHGGKTLEEASCRIKM